MAFCIGFDYLSFNFDTFLKFWENPEIQDDLPFGNHDAIMTSSLCVADFEGDNFKFTI